MKAISNVLVLLSFAAAGHVAAQPMNGSYTVGGTSPDFVTPQDVVQALKDRGVSGPVFINIRPGTYVRDGGASPVFVLDSVVAGVSPSNRITFRPDAVTGGNVDNVILQIDQETQLFQGVARVLVDYVTISNLSFTDSDSLQAGASYLLSIVRAPTLNPTIEGLADGDFDGDGDVDLIFTHAASDSLVFLLNNGNATFTRQTIPDENHKAVAAMDYDDDGDLDLAVAHLSLALEGFTIFFNEGNGTFLKKQNCFVSSLVNGVPTGMLAKHLDFDNLPDLVITTVDTVFVLFNLGGSATEVDQSSPVEVPQSFSLFQNYPNPFNPTTTIEYVLPDQSHVRLKIYNLLGEEVMTLVDEIQDAGNQRLQWRTNGVASGIYFYRIEARSIATHQTYANVRKMIVIK